MKAKIGLISYHFLNNYGTRLQAYALQRKITDLGYDAEYIDYRFEELRLAKKNSFFSRIKRIKIYLLRFQYYFKKAIYQSRTNSRIEYFDNFYQKFICLSQKRYSTLSDLELNPPEYDMYIVGSDQVWNPNLATATPAFFLSFVKDNSKKAAYAPSLGISTLTSEQQDKIFEYLRSFQFLSCRELTGIKLLEDMDLSDVSYVLDPTMLLDKLVWNEIAKTPNISKPYIFCYFLGDTIHPRKFAKKLGILTGYKVYYIPWSPLDMNKKTALYDVGPEEFLGLISNAEYVCTDSFHASIFSIIFEKQFFSFCKRLDTEKSSDNSRIKDILRLVGLEDRLVSSGQLNIDLKDEINYSIVEGRLKPLKESSETYLMKILDSAGACCND